MFDNKEVQCRYLRTASSFNAEQSLNFPDSSKIRFFDIHEAAKFGDTMRRRNVIVRLAGIDNFYFKRVGELADRTIIEVYRAAEPDAMIEIGEQIALLIEKLAILSTTPFMQRRDLLRKLGISANITPEINFVVTSQFKSIRSRSRRTPSAEGITVDRQFCNRFTKLGFMELFQYCQENSDLAKRVQTSTDWLLESRRETRLTASVVKTAIALESMLVFSESESLARSLSERTAFILSAFPDIRQVVSRVILRFYEVRSGVVHGSQKKAKRLSPLLTECVDRLTILLHLVLASNSNLWPTVEALRIWCERQRWGNPTSDVRYPFSKVYLKNALALISKELQ